VSTSDGANRNRAPSAGEALEHAGLAPNADVRPLWYVRAAERLGISPLVLTLAVGAGIALVTALVHSWAGAIDYQRRPFEPFVPYSVALGTPILMGLFQLAIRWARQAFDALRPHLAGSAARIEEWRDGLAAYPRTIYWFGALAGLAFSLPFHEVNTQRWSRFAAGDWNAFDVWVVAAVSFYVILIYQLGAALLLTVRSLGHLGETLLELDLFDPDRGRPLARFGLRLVLVFALLSAAGLVAPALLGAAAPGSAAGATAVNLIWCAVCLTLCLNGLVRQMGRLKREELARVDHAILGRADALDDSPVADRLQPLGFVDLLAYRRELDARRTWPIDARMWVRLLLYLVLPPLSWVAAALVEQGVGTLLGT
jgi:hypothetical protein